MKEYIEREAVIQLIKTDGHDGDYNLGATADNEWFCAEVKRIPAADVVEVRHGRWLDALVIDLPVQMCDQCNTFFPLAYTGGGHHYCPNCGAKMDGGANDA